MNNQFSSILRTLTVFACGQGTLQIVQALNGLLFVWLLKVPDFALYAVFTSALGFTSLMLGMGLGPTLVSLVGMDVADRAKVGRYIYAALHYRMWILLLVSPLGVALIFYTASKTGAGMKVAILLALVLVASNYLSAQNDLFATPLQMLRRTGSLYKWMVAGESVRGVLIWSLWACDCLDAVAAAAIGVAGLAVSYIGVKRASTGLLIKPDIHPIEEIRELRRLTLPLLPNALFGAFQGQIVVLLAAVLGSTQQIASVGALSRLSRLMSFIDAANPMIIGPALARMDERRFWRRVPWFLGGNSILAASIAVSGWLFPGLLVLILGSNYGDLSEILWIVTLGTGLGYYVSALGTLRSFRRWVAWWASLSTIGVVIAAQAVVVLFCDLGTLEGILWLGVAASCGRLLMSVFTIGVARFKPRWLRSHPNQSQNLC